MKPASGSLKKPTNVSIRSDLLEDARKLKLNLSREFENHLEQVVRKHRAAQWLRENHAAIQAYNRHIQEDGLWNEEFRTW